MKLSKGDIDLIAKTLQGASFIEPDEVKAFKDFLAYISSEVIPEEAQELDQKKRYFTQTKANGTQVPVDNIRGEFDLLAECALTCAKKDNRRGIENFIRLLLGRFYERQFCDIFTKLTEDTKYSYVYRFQKHLPISAASFARGIGRGFERINPPDVLFMLNGYLAMAEIKHQAVTELVNYVVEKPSYGDYKRFSQSLPLLLVIHSYDRLGKWNTDNDPQYWLARELKDLGKPYSDKLYGWPKDRFVSLEEALKKLK